MAQTCGHDHGDDGGLSGPILADELDTAAITNKGVIEQLTGVPILAEIIHGQDFLEAEDFITRA